MNCPFSASWSYRCLHTGRMGMGSAIWSGHDPIRLSQPGPGYFCTTNEEKKTKPGLSTTYCAFPGEPSGLWPANFWIQSWTRTWISSWQSPLCSLSNSFQGEPYSSGYCNSTIGILCSQSVCWSEITWLWRGHHWSKAEHTGLNWPFPQWPYGHIWPFGLANCGLC